MKYLNAERVKEIIKEMGITQAKVAEQVDIAPGYFSRILSGEKRPSTKLVERIAEELGESVSNILSVEYKKELGFTDIPQGDESNALETSLSDIFITLEKYAKQPLTEKDKKAFKQILNIIVDKYLDD